MDCRVTAISASKTRVNALVRAGPAMTLPLWFAVYDSRYCLPMRCSFTAA